MCLCLSLYGHFDWSSQVARERVRFGNVCVRVLTELERREREGERLGGSPVSDADRMLPLRRTDLLSEMEWVLFHFFLSPITSFLLGLSFLCINGVACDFGVSACLVSVCQSSESDFTEEKENCARVFSTCGSWRLVGVTLLSWAEAHQAKLITHQWAPQAFRITQWFLFYSRRTWFSVNTSTGTRLNAIASGLVFKIKSSGLSFSCSARAEAQ